MSREIANPPQLPNGWASVTVSTIGKVVTGTTPPKACSEYYGNDYPFFKPTDLNSGYYVKESRDKLSKLGLEQARLLPEKTVMVTCIGATIGKTGFARSAGACNQQINAVVVNDNVSPEFIYFMCISPKFQKSIIEKASATTLPILNKSKFEQLSIPLAPFNEQVRIVLKIEELFSYLDAGTESLRKVQVQLKRYRQAVLKYAFEGKLTEQWRIAHKEVEPAQKILEKVKQELKRSTNQSEYSSENGFVFQELPKTWAWVTIGEIETFIGSGITPKGGRAVYVQEGVPFVRSQNVYPDGLRLKEIAYVTPKMHESMKRTKAYPNDVLLNITGASIGRSAVIPVNLPEANVNQHVCIIRSGWWIIPAYLSHFLNSPFGQAEIFGTQSGVTRQGLNYSQLRGLKIPLAPLPEQQEITAIIEASYSLLWQTEKSIRENIEYSKSLRQSILKDAFSGKLVIQDPHDEPAEKLLACIKAERLTNKSKNNQVELSTYVK